MHQPDCNKLPLRTLLAALAGVSVLLACRATPEKPAEPPVPPVAIEPAPATPAKPEVPAIVQPTPPLPANHLRRGAWNDLPGWRDDDPAAAWNALLTSCSTLKTQESWRAVCAAAAALQRPNREQARRFF